MVAAIGTGAGAIVNGAVSIFTGLVANENVVTLIGIYIGYKLFKTVLGFIPMFRNN